MTFVGVVATLSFLQVAAKSQSHTITRYTITITGDSTIYVHFVYIIHSGLQNINN